MSEWKMVPVEPTGKMVAAGSWGAAAGMRDSDVMELWRDMVGAAPSPWASMSERTPPEGRPVLVMSQSWLDPRVLRYVPNPYPRMRDDMSGRWYWYPERMHWCELPALPPSEGGA